MFNSMMYNISIILPILQKNMDRHSGRTLNINAVNKVKYIQNVGIG